MMEVISFCELYVPDYTMQQPDDSHLHACLENLKSYQTEEKLEYSGVQGDQFLKCNVAFCQTTLTDYSSHISFLYLKFIQ